MYKVLRYKSLHFIPQYLVSYKILIKIKIQISDRKSWQTLEGQMQFKNVYSYYPT